MFRAKDLSSIICITHEQAMCIELKDLVDALPHNSLATKQFIAMKMDYDLLMRGYKEMQEKLSSPITYFSIFGQ